MGEIARGCVATITIAFAPVVAEGLRFSVSTLLLSFAFSATFPASLRCPALLPKPLWSFLMNFSFLSCAGWISRAMTAYSATVTFHLSRIRLGVAVHDGEARVPFFPTLLVHFTSSSFSKLIGVYELYAQFCVVRQVISSVISSCVVLTVRNRV
jgi:hypothetical protein